MCGEAFDCWCDSIRYTIVVVCSLLDERAVVVKKFALKNYRCLQDVDVPLAPFNVVVGPNSSGKSAFLNALRQFSNMANGYLTDPACWLGQDPVSLPSYWAKDEKWISFDCAFEVSSPKGEPCLFDYSLELAAQKDLPAHQEVYLGVAKESLRYKGVPIAARDGQDGQLALMGDLGEVAKKSPSANETIFRYSQTDSFLPKNLENYPFRDEIVAASEFLQSVSYIDFRPEAISDWGEPKATALNELAADGRNLMDILEFVRDAEPDAFAAINDSLRKMVPGCAGLTFERKLHPVYESVSAESGSILPQGPKKIDERLKKRLAFRFIDNGGEVTLSSEVVSSGLLLFTAFITLVNISHRPSVFLVEEPERGVHPSRLRDIVEWLKKIATAADGKPATQVIMTTHSPYLLDWCQPEEILIFHRPDGKDTKVKRMCDVDNVHKGLAQLQPGELWTAMTEDKLIK